MPTSATPHRATDSGVDEPPCFPSLPRTCPLPGRSRPLLETGLVAALPTAIAVACAVGAQTPPLLAPHFPEGPLRAPRTQEFLQGHMHQGGGRTQPGLLGCLSDGLLSVPAARHSLRVPSHPACPGGGQDASLQCTAGPTLAGTGCSQALRGLHPSVRPVQEGRPLLDLSPRPKPLRGRASLRQPASPLKSELSMCSHGSHQMATSQQGHHHRKTHSLSWVPLGSQMLPVKVQCFGFLALTS